MAFFFVRRLGLGHTRARSVPFHARLSIRRISMTWTKPEFKDVAVTLEVTAYAARR
jgi:coenzyme PQQ precursor peptide PqqA